MKRATRGPLESAANSGYLALALSYCGDQGAFASVRSKYGCHRPVSKGRGNLLRQVRGWRIVPVARGRLRVALVREKGDAHQRRQNIDAGGALQNHRRGPELCRPCPRIGQAGAEGAALL